MLKLILQEEEFYNEKTETFETVGGVELELEHSLISLSKWESKYKKPFLSSDSKTTKEILYYIECMVISPMQSLDMLEMLTQNNIDRINDYIESSESATTFGVMPERKGRGEVITAELIYYWLVAFNIPFECEYWHLNRLFALIRICNIKNSPQKKMSRNEISARNRELNAVRRAQYNTNG